MLDIATLVIAQCWGGSDGNCCRESVQHTLLAAYLELAIKNVIESLSERASQ